ncbi:uncharacterized protein LOC115091785 [Rhinatrema bivittatum]|uniref:uncharacterized protein LOC115091785 n=1 Tax=Rhinatrema bivittatum TaxID=194408 RepID=UPI0011296D23|nr:uncharacterized protein LOC115091785 [Rhinatrema bivittatum]XP_029457855.1 uncharacterized protein LOC115091785 [Rhinatrema bivittatum]XP_029457856.1 uncharacterized protein LOC115091785 [Rhinatrema bivittatum]
MASVAGNSAGKEMQKTAEKRKLAQMEREAEGQEEQAGPSSSQEPAKRARDVCFSDAGKELLCRCICENYQVLFHSKTSSETKKRIWERIALDVSSLKVKTRNVKQVQHRWRDTCREVKEKAAKIVVSRHGTGCAPSRTLVLTPTEELIVHTLQPDVVDGVQTPYGCDTAQREDQVLNNLDSLVETAVEGETESPSTPEFHFLMPTPESSRPQSLLVEESQPELPITLALEEELPEMQEVETTAGRKEIGEEVGGRTPLNKLDGLGADIVVDLPLHQQRFSDSVTQGWNSVRSQLQEMRRENREAMVTMADLMGQLICAVKDVASALRPAK